MLAVSHPQAGAWCALPSVYCYAIYIRPTLKSYLKDTFQKTYRSEHCWHGKIKRQNLGKHQSIWNRMAIIPAGRQCPISAYWPDMIAFQNICSIFPTSICPVCHTSYLHLPDMQSRHYEFKSTPNLPGTVTHKITGKSVNCIGVARPVWTSYDLTLYFLKFFIIIFSFVYSWFTFVWFVLILGPL